MGLTLEFAEFIAGLRSDDIDDNALAIAQLGCVDTIATAFAGVHDDASQKVMTFARRRIIQESDICKLPWLLDTMPVPMAALVFGTTAHALDFDDVALSGHPSTVLVPAILCEGLARGLPGRTCLEAYVVGYQVWAELFQREPDSLHIKGWHPTAVYGVLAATAAIAYARDMATNSIATSLAIAASLASGLVANFGTMTKPLHAGRAASLAFEAIEYGNLGITAAEDALEHHAGFLNAVSPSGNVNRSTAMHQEDGWLISQHGLCIKQYPVCYSGHRAIDATIDLASTHNVALEDVLRVSVGLGRPQLSMLRNHQPKTSLEAKFSIQFAVACALDQRNVGLSQLVNEYVNRPHLQDFYTKVDTWCVETPDPDDPTFSKYDSVELTLRDGRVLKSGDIPYARGHAANPISTEALRYKFQDCLTRFTEHSDGSASAILPEVNTLFSRLTKIATSENIAQIFTK